MYENKMVLQKMCGGYGHEDTKTQGNFDTMAQRH